MFLPTKVVSKPLSVLLSLRPQITFKIGSQATSKKLPTCRQGVAVGPAHESITDQRDVKFLA